MHVKIPLVRNAADKDYYFRDGIRRIDFVLVYLQQATHVEDEESRAIVNSFITKMERLGLEFETELATINSTMTFIKVHSPLDVLYYHAKVHHVNLEKNNINMQFKQGKSTGLHYLFGKTNTDALGRATSVAAFSRRPVEPTTSERIFITHKILNSYEDNAGYQMCIAGGHLYSAYPLHDGDYNWSNEGKLNDRQMLNKYWSSFSVFYKKQPLDLINRYFGSAIAFYFAWMGFYIKALCTIFMVGVITTIYGIITVNMPSINTKSERFCSGTEVICAKCSNFDICPFSYVNVSCSSSRLNYILENDSVIINAILLSIWGTLYFVFWRRYENTLSYRWDLYDLKAEVTFRAQYPRRTAYRRISPYTNQLEPYTPKRVAAYKLTVSIVVLFIMVLLVLIVLFAVIAFRVYRYPVTDPYYFLKYNMETEKIITGSFLAVIFILFFEMAFEIICMRLVNFINPPSNKKFDKNLILKMFTFGFLNGFSHLIYGSFVKSRLYTHPGLQFRSKFFSMMMMDLCELNDCVMDICFQLVGILLGTALLRTSREIIAPTVRSWYIYWKAKRQQLYDEEVHVWERDLYKASFRRYNLVFSYKHILLQYGYITLFAAVFPITPLFSLIYNVIEIRADAIKLIRNFRRPIPYRKKGIGAWNTILRFMTMISVTTNTLIISFTSDFVQRMISEKKTDDEKPSRFSTFATKDYANWEKNRHKTPFPDMEECFYFADRHPANSTRKYTPKITNIFVISCQLLVFLVLEHIILFLTAFVEMIVPQIPSSLEEQMHKVRVLSIEKKEFAAEL